MTRHHRRPPFGTRKPTCEALDGRILLSVLGLAPENPPAEFAATGALRVCPKRAGDCPNFAESSEQNGTVPLSEAHLKQTLNAL